MSPSPALCSSGAAPVGHAMWVLVPRVWSRDQVLHCQQAPRWCWWFRDHNLCSKHFAGRVPQVLGRWREAWSLLFPSVPGKKILKPCELPGGRVAEFPIRRLALSCWGSLASCFWGSHFWWTRSEVLVPGGGMCVTHCRACHLRSLADLRVLPSTCRGGSEPLDGTSLMSSCPIGL